MKFTLNWLKKFLDTDADISRIVDSCNQIGHEVECVIDHRETLGRFIVAEVKNVRKHPDADKLNICSVFDGKEDIQVVCGAKNVASGQKIVFAKPGVVIPSDGLKIKAAKIRGVESFGMICSDEELGFSSHSEGIKVLSDTSIVGASLLDEMPHLNDPIIDLSITPNRPDCLGVYGIARDLAAKGIGKLKEIPEAHITSEFDFPKNIIIDSDSGCKKFAAIYVKNVSNRESPEWLRALLESVGCMPRNFAVDVTNYINMSFARPLHVYDADKVSGDLEVRYALDKETFTSLDQKKYELTVKDVVISDNDKILTLGGIIGGESSKCDIHSKNIIIESALWDPIKISSTSKTHLIETDSKHRFERGVDHEFTCKGALLAAQMILEFCGGEASKLILKENSKNDNFDHTEVILFDINKVKLVGGISVSEKRVTEILNNLGFKVQNAGIDVIKVNIPSWRHDISIQEDLVEEILRIEGYDKIPNGQIVSVGQESKMLSNKESKIIDVPNIMASIGYNEVISWSFSNSKNLKLFGLDFSKLKIANPISEDLDCIRPSIIPNLVDCLSKNNNRGFDSVSIFEIGPVFKSSEPNDQYKCISGLRSGVAEYSGIYNKHRDFDIFDVKADVVRVLEHFGFRVQDVSFNQDDIRTEFLHPGQSASVVINNKNVGFIGAIHPTIKQKLKIKKNVFCFELNFNQLKPYSNTKIVYNISDYQPVDRDFAFLVNDEIKVGQVLQSVSNLNSEIIQNVYLFDLYAGDDIGNGMKSIAFRVRLQSSDKTLDSNTIEELSEKIISLVEEKYCGKLRS